MKEYYICDFLLNEVKYHINSEMKFLIKNKNEDI